MNLSFACSLRMGEILGLTWENVHISDEDIAADNAYGYIDKELTRASKRAIETLGEKDIYYIFTPLMPNTSTRIILKKPKTDSSIRKVWLPKTLAYLMRQIERKLNQGPQYLMAVVSLFGIEDTNTLTKKVKEAVVYAQTFNKAEKSGKGHIAKGVNVVKQLSEKVAAFGELFDFGKIKKIAKSANMLLSIDVYDFLPIEKEVYCIVAGEEQPVKKKLVLVFDDFERCKIGVIDLLGIINTYVEDKGIKTVIIASEDNIKDEENYKTFKEKVVERTVKLDVEYRRIQQEMIGNYKAKTSEYTEFLKTESPKLFQVFEESETRNLRTFKSCLIDFERVYELWCRLKLPTDGMGGALYVFAAYLFEVKGGNYKKLNEYDEYTFNFLERTSEDKKRKSPPWQTIQDDENSKYKRYNAQYRIQPLIRWMIEGEWDEQRIKTALRQRFSVKETAPEREVLDKAFWELSQEIIDRGLPQVLQQAYDYFLLGTL